MTTVEITGATELLAGLSQLTDVREITEAGTAAARTLETAARDLAPSTSGTLSGSIGATVTERTVAVGSSSPYARWFHVPYLSDGGVAYAKKVSTRGRGYGQRIPNNPFFVNAARKVQTQLFDGYLKGTVALVERALANVPRAL